MHQSFDDLVPFDSCQLCKAHVILICLTDPSCGEEDEPGGLHVQGVALLLRRLLTKPLCLEDT